MKITIAQLNPVVGDIEGNLKRIKNVLSQHSEHSDLILFSELFLVGYPPKDLLERAWFIEKAQTAVHDLMKISADYPQTGILLGAPVPTGANTGNGLYNAALLIYQGEILGSQYKSLLPTYDVFDEARYFDPAPEVDVIAFKDEKLGISICEDAWNNPELWPRKVYSFDPMEAMAQKGATIFVDISASPFHVGKEDIRYRTLTSHVKSHKIPFVYVNQVGGNDELIFDGKSMCIDANGNLLEIFPPFREHVQTVDMTGPERPGIYVQQNKTESVYQALVLGVRDYMGKCGFANAVVGLSGGLDSAVVCCLVKDAVGTGNVLGVSMPSPYSLRESVEDAEKLAKNLSIQFKVIRISSIFHSYVESLKEDLKVQEEIDVTLENIQARIRGNILMSISNKFGQLVLSTGNKSELAVGYCTLYGDMSGGLAVISDVPKTMVYELADYINRKSEIIPRTIIEKAPSAELKPDQVDQDVLPPYDILDRILYYHIEEGYSKKEILDLNFEPETVEWVIRAVKKSEYKRRQVPPGLKVTTKAFGVGRRMPIAAKYEM